MTSVGRALVAAPVDRATTHAAHALAEIRRAARLAGEDPAVSAAGLADALAAAERLTALLAGVRVGLVDVPDRLAGKNSGGRAVGS